MTLRVNCVTERPGWILHRCAQELATRLPDVTVNGAGPADLHYCLPAYYRSAPHGLRVGFFTHPTDQQLQDFVPVCQGHVCMNRTVQARLRAAGAPDPQIIRPGTSVETPTRLVFGVCGRTYATQRKGEHLVAQMVQAGFSVLGWGKGWPCPIVSDRVADLPVFYDAIHYLVVTSTEEGGPVPVVDALASGVAVIAPDVGWCWELPCVHYARGDWASLHGVLHALTHPPTWAAWAQQHHDLFARLVA